MGGAGGSGGVAGGAGSVCLGVRAANAERNGRMTALRVDLS